MDPCARIGTRDVVVSVSGGKDSAAACLHLRELGIPFTAMFMDTGWEHASTYRYIDDVLEPRFGPIVRLRQPVAVAPGAEGFVAELEAMLGHESPMVRLCIGKGCFPGQGTRWCTACLKAVPAARWLADRDDTVNVVGIRREESEKRKGAFEWEAMPDAEVNPIVRLPGEGVWFRLAHVEQWRPLVEWTEEDVVRVHQRHGLPLNPLYRLGAGRVGCWPCIFARKTDIKLLAATDPGRVAVIRRLEEIVQQFARVRIEASGRTKETPPPTWFQARDPVALDAWRQDHGVGDDGGPHLCISIDRAIEWARTARGGRQFEMFGPADRDWACSRFGFCETRATA